MRLYILYLFEGNFTLPRRSWRSIGVIYDRTRERLHRGNANRVRRNGRHFLNVSLFPSSSFSLTLSFTLSLLFSSKLGALPRTTYRKFTE